LCVGGCDALSASTNLSSSCGRSAGLRPVTETVIARRRSSGRADHLITRFRSSETAVWLLLAIVAVIVLPPFAFLVRASFTLGNSSVDAPQYGLANFISVLG